VRILSARPSVLHFAVIAALRRGATLLLMAMIAACATATVPPFPVSLTYTPDRNAQPVSGSEAVHVEVTVNDLRQEKNTLGEVSGGPQTVSIFTNDDLAELIKSAIQSELVDRDFELGSGNALVVVDLEGISVHRKIGANPSAWAEVIFKVQVEQKTGAVLYSREVDGTTSLALPHESGSGGSQHALNSALDDAVQRLMADPAFINALLSTRKPGN
jgi:uncharacterized lipoprotein YajG